LDLTQSADAPFSFGAPKSRGWEQKPMREIMDQLQGGSSNPIDLTAEQHLTPQKEAVTMAERTAVKFIQFSENVRPAYWGTYTVPVSLPQLRKLGRSPYTKVHHLNYDYDSEAEWEEEEGDDVSDDEEEEEDGEDDMDGFVDDEDSGPGSLKKQPVLTGGMTPVCTGLQWEDEHGVLHSADGGPLLIDLEPLEMEFLLRKHHLLQLFF
jgi:chromatin assembly factor 1 subunit A